MRPIFSTLFKFNNAPADFPIAGGHQRIDAAGSGGVRIRIYYDDLGAFAFPLPPLAEQARVLAVLDAGVTEIETLEHYLAALQKQKRGLMQKLLTGQWRVPTSKGDSLDE